MGGPDHGLWSNEHPSTAGLDSVMNHTNYPPQASHTSATGDDTGSLPHTITVSCLLLAYPHATLIDVTFSEATHRTSREPN